MILINGTKFWDKPGSCGTCPFFISGSSRLSPSDRGVCTLWNENHRTYINPPRRCQKLFNKASRYPDGTKLVIVAENS